MEGARTGPLSYDVTAPAGEASAEKPIVVGGLATVAMMVLGMVGGWFLLGWVADAAVVVAGIPVAMVVIAMALVLWAARHSLRRARRVAVGVVLATSLVAAFLTNQALANVEPALPQVRHTLASLDLPDGFSLVGETTRGDRFCRNGCPTVVRRYSTPARDPDPVRTLILAMFAQGWERTSDVAPELATTAHRDRVTAHLQDRGPRVVEVTAVRDSS